MRSIAQSRHRKVVWPDKRRWEDEFATRLLADKNASAAFRKLMREGCLCGNVMSSLYAYTFGPTTVFRDYSRRRGIALEGLKAVAGRLDRASLAMQELLDLEWRSEPTFASFLRERCRFDVQTASSDGTVIRGKSAPDFALGLPTILRGHSRALKRLRKELQKKLCARGVGKAFYLAELATYIAAVTQKQVPWNVLAELVNTARPEEWKEKHVDPSLLQKNFANFTRRNEELYRQIRVDMAAYLADYAELPREKRPTFLRWTLDRRSAS
jgi:hypothetical protein